MSAYYFIGIKGSGMSALACILHDLGYLVMGSDTMKYFCTQDGLHDRNIKVFSFDENNIKSDYTIIIGNAIPDSNNEVVMAKKCNLHTYYYHEFLGFFFKNKKIAVAGTHGKTTTTKLLSAVFSNQTYLIGDGTGKGVKDSEWFIYEACEYKDHFLAYKQDYGIITNIELEHTDYFTSVDMVIKSFQQFVDHSKVIIACGDCDNVRKLKGNHIVTYGFHRRNTVCASILKKDEFGFDVEISIYGEKEVKRVPFFGIHMLYNYLAVYTMSFLVKKDCNVSFELPKRRFHEISIKNQIIIDDYAHHPTEINAVLDAVKHKYPNRSIAVVFQPHTYSRTEFFQKMFVNVLKTADIVYFDEIFSSARENCGIITRDDLVKMLKKSKKLDDLAFYELLQLDDYVIIFMGAGDVFKHYYKYLQLLNEK